MTKNSDDGKHAMLFVFTDCIEMSFFEEKMEKCHFSYRYANIT
jgi:hypothetical protein